MELNSGLLHHSRKERNRKSIEAALQSLTTSHQDPSNPGQNRRPVLMKWEQEVIYKKKGGGQAIADVKYPVWPSVYLVADIKAANARRRDGRNILQIVPRGDHSPFVDELSAVQAPLDARAAEGKKRVGGRWKVPRSFLTQVQDPKCGRWKVQNPRKW